MPTGEYRRYRGLIRYEARYNAVIYYDAMTLINTLVSSFRDALAIALVSDEVGFT